MTKQHALPLQSPPPSKPNRGLRAAQPLLTTAQNSAFAIFLQIFDAFVPERSPYSSHAIAARRLSVFGI